MLQINSEMFAQIMERFDRIERALERMNKLKDAWTATRSWTTTTCAGCSASPNARWRVTARRSS